METSVRFILLGLGIIIILLIVWDGLRRKRRQSRDAPIRTINLKKVKEKAVEKKSATPMAPQYSEFDDDVVGEVRFISAEPPAAQPVPSPVPMPTPAPQPARHQQQEMPAEAATQVLERPQAEPVSAPMEAQFVMLHVKAADIEPFGGYRLLQILLRHHLRFGKHGFFHAHESKAPDSNILFSVASEAAPGSFDPKNMGAYECPGLVLYMNRTKHKRPLAVFDQMLETARELACDLGGELQIAPGQPADESTISALRRSF